MQTAVIVAFDKFTDVDVFLPWDLLNRVKLQKPDWQVKIVGTQPEHTSVCGLEIAMHDTIEACNDADLVLFASGPGAREVVKDPAYLQRFRLNPDRQVIGSMCSGALILAALGLLDGLTATTYPTSVDLLRAYGVEVVEQPLVTHGNLATAAGCLAAVDLIAWMIERKLGRSVSQQVIATVQPVGQGLAFSY